MFSRYSKVVVVVVVNEGTIDSSTFTTFFKSWSRYLFSSYNYSERIEVKDRSGLTLMNSSSSCSISYSFLEADFILLYNRITKQLDVSKSES